MSRGKQALSQAMIKGGHRADRDKQVTGQTLSVIPKSPFELSEEAARIWHSTCAWLVEEQIAINADLHLLSAYCEQMSLYDFSMKDVKKRGPVIIWDNGKQEIPMQNPYLKSANGCLRNAIQLAKEMGFTPRSRTTVAPYFESKKQPTLFDEAEGFMR